MRTAFLFALSIFIAGSTFAQLPAYGRRLVDTLSSPAFWGRGYTNKGMEKAAGFIAKQFDSLGLQPVGNQYLQTFDYAVNTFPGKMEVTINAQKLQPGVDFIVAPESRGFTGALHFQVQDSTHFMDAGNRVAIALQDKLTWSVSDKVADYTLLLVNRASIADYPKKANISIENKLIRDFGAANVCGKVTGTKFPNSLLVISAHYDHLGGMGSATYFPGANDNASGTALLLNLAAYYAQHPAPFTIVFIAFAGEEAGLKGSEYFVNHPLVKLEHISFLLNLDLEGNGSDGITVVNGTLFKKAFALLNKVNETGHYIPQINARGKAANSDHYWFTEKGVPSFFMYTLGGSKAYHDIFDKPETLPMDEFEDLLTLIIEFNKLLMN